MLPKLPHAASPRRLHRLGRTRRHPGEHLFKSPELTPPITECRSPFNLNLRVLQPESGPKYAAFARVLARAHRRMLHARFHQELKRGSPLARRPVREPLGWLRQRSERRASVAAWPGDGMLKQLAKLPAALATDVAQGVLDRRSIMATPSPRRHPLGQHAPRCPFTRRKTKLHDRVTTRRRPPRWRAGRRAEKKQPATAKAWFSVGSSTRWARLLSGTKRTHWQSNRGKHPRCGEALRRKAPRTVEAARWSDRAAHATRNSYSRVLTSEKGVPYGTRQAYLLQGGHGSPGMLTVQPYRDRLGNAHSSGKERRRATSSTPLVAGSVVVVPADLMLPTPSSCFASVSVS